MPPVLVEGAAASQCGDSSDNTQLGLLGVKQRMALKDVRRKLWQASGDDFHKLSSNVLKDLLPAYRDSGRLKELDRLGVDAWSPNETGAFDLIVQYKGFEKENFGKGQLKQLIAEVRKFAKKGVKTTKYWLVYNRFIADPVSKQAIETELSNLVSSGQVDETLLLGIDDFLKEIRRIGVEQFKTRAIDFSRKTLEEYAAWSGSYKTVHEIPFSKDGARQTSDLAAVIAMEVLEYLQDLKEHQTAQYRNPPTFLIKATFGFGKTTTVLRLAELFSIAGLTPITIPASMLSDKAFQNTSGISRSLVDLLWNDTAPLADETKDCLVYSIRREFGKARDFVIILDALDENENTWNEKKFRDLRNGLRELSAPQVITVREEMLEQRRYEILEALKESNPAPLVEVALHSWQRETMQQFMEIAERGDGEISEHERWFRSIISEGRYEDHYGDIPARPLFMRMLFDQARTGKRPEARLQKLLESFILAKLKRDTQGSIGPIRPSRPGTDLVYRSGQEEFHWALVRVMSYAARRMHDTKPYTGLISLGTLNGLVKDCLTQVALTSEALNFSLLLPSGRDPYTRELQYRFAHKIFEDWFLANYYFTSRISPEKDHFTETAYQLWAAMEADQSN